MAPKYLIQKFPKKGVANIYAYTEALASRTDMEPYAGPVPPSMRIDLNKPVTAAKVVPFGVSPELGHDACYPVVSAVPAAVVLEPTVEAPKEPDANKIPDAPDSSVPGAPQGVSGEGGDPAVPGGYPSKDPEEGSEKSISLIPKYTPEQKLAKLVEVMGKLKPEDFTGTGLPKVDNLMLALGGVDVSAVERDAAWKIVSQNKGK